MKNRYGGGNDGFDDGNGGNFGGRGRGGGGGGGGDDDDREGSPSGDKLKSMESDEKYQIVNQLIYTSLLKVLQIDEINQMVA